MDENLEKFKKLTPLDARMRLKDLTGWQIENNRLEKEFRFKDFTHAVIFLNKIVNPIEENQNYPRLVLTYDRVLVSLFNSAVGSLTAVDFSMAQEIESLSGGSIQPKTTSIKA